MHYLRIFLFLAIYFSISGCADRTLSPTIPAALDVGTSKTIFVATTRHQEQDGSYGSRRSEYFSLLENTVSIPPNHQPGQLEFSYGNPNPKTQFTMADRRRFSSDEEFGRRLRQELDLRSPRDREVVVFVHGFNTTQAESTFRAAQLTHDVNSPGATVVYSWPSLGSPLGYAYDGDSILFARDGLEQLLHKLKSAGARQIILVAHSLGSVLTMEALRQIEIKSPRWATNNLSGVVLMSPDLDVDVFRSQMSRFEEVPQPFVVFVSQKDTILNISQRIRGTHSRERLGNISSLDLISDLPIEVVDTTAYADTAESGHFVAATSPALLSLLNAAREAAESFENPRAEVRDLLPGLITKEEEAVQVSLLAPENTDR